MNKIEKNKKVISDLIRYAYEKKGINAKLLKSRRRFVVDTNIALAKCIKDNMSLTFQNVGFIFNKSHCTIVYYMKQHDLLFKTDSSYVKDYQDYKNYIEDYYLKNNKSKEFVKEDLSIYLSKMNQLREENKLLTNELDTYKKENETIKYELKRLSKFANW
tara:strand:- start:287 stop:766 length:480 start_codon:yes stop_codon:yes gene_type:complete